MNVAQSQNLNLQAREARRLSESSAINAGGYAAAPRFGALHDSNRPTSGSMLRCLPRRRSNAARNYVQGWKGRLSGRLFCEHWRESNVAPPADPSSRRHRRPEQSRQPQKQSRASAHPLRRSQAVLSAKILTRPEPDRTGLCQAQTSASQGSRTNHRCGLRRQFHDRYGSKLARVFRVIGIQSGPRDRGSQWLPSSHGSWDAGGADD